MEPRLQESSISNEQIIASLSKLNNDVKLWTLKCNSFSDNDKNKFAFHTFLNQFNNLIDSRQNMSNASKLAYLINNLNEKALQLIIHLTVNNNNYETAITILKEEILNVPSLINASLEKLINLTPDSIVLKV